MRLFKIDLCVVYIMDTIEKSLQLMDSLSVANLVISICSVRIMVPMNGAARVQNPNESGEGQIL